MKHIQAKLHHDQRGNLYVVEGTQTIPFQIERVFWVTDPVGVRGEHAHLVCTQAIFIVTGSMLVKIDEEETYLYDYGQGIIVPPQFTVTLSDFSADCSYLVLCSTHYDSNDVVVI